LRVPPTIPWTPDLETGHLEIDAQHKTILEAMNRLQDAVASEDGEEKTGWCLSFIKAYAKVHFRTEEALFASHPDLPVEAHLAAHQQLSREADALFRRFLKGEKGLQDAVLAILHHWVTDHIRNEDCPTLRRIPPGS
jgi:hemerythrin-like metal-binding protein